MSSEPKTTSSTLGPERGFCEGFKAGVEGVEVMEATSGAIGLVTTTRAEGRRACGVASGEPGRSFSHGG